MRLSAPIFRLKREARLLAREKGIPLHRALDQVAQAEGFRGWSHLAASIPEHKPATEILAQLAPGDLVLLGARPGHGKTLLGLGLAIEAAKTGRRGYFFTLEDSEGTVGARAGALGADLKALEKSLTLDTHDGICAEYVIRRVEGTPGEAVVVIDYLQLLDQKRSNPELIEQIRALRAFAKATNSIIVVLSQIDRAFDGQAGRLPELADVRLPNPLDLTLFTKTCFLHAGEIRLETIF